MNKYLYIASSLNSNVINLFLCLWDNLNVTNNFNFRISNKEIVLDNERY